MDPPYGIKEFDRNKKRLRQKPNLRKVNARCKKKARALNLRK